MGLIINHAQAMEKEHHEVVTKLERGQKETISKMRNQHQNTVATMKNQHQEMVSKMENQHQDLVEKVMGKRKSLKQLGGVEYYVKWLGWGSESNTWEPAKHLETCPELVDQFEKELSHKEEKKTRKKWKKEVYTINVAHEGSKSSIEDYNSNNLSVRMDNLDEENL